jgi:hypothetical protein
MNVYILWKRSHILGSMAGNYMSSSLGHLLHYFRRFITFSGMDIKLLQHPTAPTQNIHTYTIKPLDVGFISLLKTRL